MGGAAGHMAHPFDLGWVNTGSDLLDFFERAKTYLEKQGAGSVKIDGVNVSFKVVGELDKQKQFAVDRGSLKPIDIEGITMSRVDDRFPEGHGMRPAIKTLLSILNEALPSIRSELISLGMWDDPSRFLNTEYVEGTTNVTEYDENFLAIHGLNQFYHRVGKSGASKGNVRPGAERPDNSKAPSTEIPYDPGVMEKLVKKLNPIANERGFQVYGSVPTEKMADIEYDDVLSEPFTVKVSDDREITKSLGEWLSEAANPRYKTVKLKDGTRTHPLHKQLYLNILQQKVPIVDLIEDNDAEAAIYGAVMMHATRLLGNKVLGGLTSPMGDVMNHEGVVIRDDKLFGPNPVKITGEFILGNLGGGFGQGPQQPVIMKEDEPALDDEDADPVGQPVDVEARKIALVPGAFKPPHRGHLGMVEKYADMAHEVIVLISRPLKSGRKLPNGREITAEDSEQMWESLVSHLPNVQVQISDHASPINATYDFIGENGPLHEGDSVILGASTKGNDTARFKMADNYLKPGVELIPVENSAVDPVKHSTYYMDLLKDSPILEELPSFKDPEKNIDEFHASDMRHLLGIADKDEEAIELLEDFTGDDNVFDFLSILGINTGLNEISSGAGGSNVGYSGNVVPKKDKKKDKVMRRTLGIAENNTTDEVMRLIMEKGLIR